MAIYPAGKIRVAVVSWQTRAESPEIAPVKQNAGPFTDWHARFNLPHVQLCLVPLVPPRWADARSCISSIPLLVSSLTQTPALQRWRRAPLGRSSSQCHLQESEARLPVGALTALNTRLMKKSAILIWQQEAVQHRRWRDSLPWDRLGSLTGDESVCVMCAMFMT